MFSGSVLLGRVRRKRDPNLSNPIQVRLFKEDETAVKQLAGELRCTEAELIRQLASAGLRAIRDNELAIKSIADQIVFSPPKPQTGAKYTGVRSAAEAAALNEKHGEKEKK